MSKPQMPLPCLLEHTVIGHGCSMGVMWGVQEIQPTNVAGSKQDAAIVRKQHTMSTPKL
jgi:hypothetical protein